MREALKYSALVLAGKLIAAVLGLISLMLAARALSLAEFGLLMLVISYKQICNRVLNVQTWQAVVRYGKKYLHEDNENALTSLLATCLRIDFFTAILAALLGILAVYPLAQFVDTFTSSGIWFAIYTLALATNLRGYTTGLYRLYERFHYQSAVLVAASIIKLIGAYLLYISDRSFLDFFLLWMATDIFINVTELIIVKLCGWLFIRIRPSPLGKRYNHEGLNSFLWHTHVDGLSKIIREVDSFIIASAINIEASAIYNVAKKFASIILMYADTAYEVGYSYVNRMIQSAEWGVLKRSCIQMSLFTGIPALIACLIFYASSDFMISSTVGTQYVANANVIVILLASSSIWAFGYPITAVNMGTGNSRDVALVNLLVTVVYIILIILLAVKYKVEGASYAHLTAHIFWLLLMLVITKYRHPERKK